MVARASRPAPGGFTHRPELDGIRGIAILVVFVFHSRVIIPMPVDAGRMGVDLFFVLSGFLITSLLMQEHISSGRISMRHFYARRGLRLLPALLLGLGIGAVVTQIVRTNGPDGMPYSQAAITAAFFAGNWFQHQLGALAHTWSLGLEEQYYLAWPFILAFALRRKARTRHIVVPLVFVTTAVALARSLIHHGMTAPTSHPLYALSRADGVLIGSALALVLTSSHAGVAMQALRDRSMVTAALVIVAAIAVWAKVETPVSYDLMILADVAFVIIVGHAYADPDSPISRLLRIQPLPAIGRISYGLYLFHYPLFFLMRRSSPSPVQAVAIAWALSFFVAIVSYFGIERPILRLKSKLRATRVPDHDPGVVTAPTSRYAAPSRRRPESRRPRARPERVPATT